MKKRLFSLILALLMTSSAFISCSNEDDETSKKPDESESQQESESKETTWIDLLPTEAYFEDYSFVIGVSTPNEGLRTSETFVNPDDIEVGDIVAQAVYDRNLKTEDKLGIVISSETFGNDWADAQRAITNLTAGGDNPYDAYDISLTYAINCAAAGLFADLNMIDTIDLDNEWWDQSTREMYDFGSKNLFFVNGDINYYDDYSTMPMFFDQALAEEYELENVYDIVREGNWTFDKFIELCKAVETYYGPDSTENIYGYTDHTAILSHFMPGFGEPLIIISEEDGTASVNQTERCVEMVDKLFSNLVGMNNTHTNINGSSDDKGSGDGLFRYTLVNAVESLREREDVYGFVPYPKYDETQDRYYNAIECPWTTVYAIPFDSNVLEQTGYILDVMGYYSQDTLYTAVIENSVYVKGIRNPDSAEMLDIIFNSRFLELGQAGTSVYDNFVNMVGQGSNTYASTAKRIDKITRNAFKSIAENFQYE